MKYIIPLLFIMGKMCVGYTQDPEFTQFYANPIYLNPALAGAKDCPKLHMTYRNQWPNISGAYVTNTVSYDTYLPALSGGVGLIVMQDNAGHGVLNTSTISLVYSYHMDLSPRYRLLIGGQATWNQRFLDWQKLTFGDQIDPLRGFVRSTGDLPSGDLIRDRWGTKGYFDVSTGIVVYSDLFYAGIAVKHLNTPDQSLILGESYLPIRFTAHTGMNIPLKTMSRKGDEVFFSPNIIYTRQDRFHQLNIGASVKVSSATFGISWRNHTVSSSDAFILLMGVSTPKIDIGYSYDITISSLSNATGGAHELSLGFHFPCKERRKPFRTITCPSF